MISPAPSQRLELKDVTVCAAASTNVEATIRALEASIAQVRFARALLFTDIDPAQAGIAYSPDIAVVRIDPIRSSREYSEFLLQRLPDHIETDHCLIVQWDGHVIDAARWCDEFLDYDYIGASWPQFDDGHDVGNGGFSLRSLRLMRACRDPDFETHHPEDVAIARTNRNWLEGQGMRFAPSHLADLFAAERAGDPDVAFGYHGVFLMPSVLGAERFWRIYRSLDDRATVRHDFGRLLREVMAGSRGLFRALQFTWHRITDRFSSGF